MQGFKKTLVALLAVAMVLSLVGPVFAAPADVAGTKYEDAAVRLIALGIFKGDDKGNFNPDAPITRAEAAAVIVRALGLEKSADLMKGVTKFADVNADAGLQWATGAINIAVSNGIVNGYPNGQFGGRDNVTYAQLAKMLLYALNYGVVVEGGVWPTAVLAKADDLSMLDNMSVVADAPILRGDAAKMIDNSLDVKSLKQFGYGDIQQYDETGKTLLESMGLDELEGRVVEIPEVAGGLDDDEVTLEITKKNGNEIKGGDSKTYTQLEGVDVQGLFGLEVKAWVDDDKEKIVFVEKKTADKDVYTDTINELVAKDEVKLDVLDDEVELSDDAVVYVNFSKKSVRDATKDLKVGQYGRFVKKNNKIVFASIFDFGSNEGIVTSVDGKKVKYFTTSNTERTLILSSADSINVYNADLTKSSLDDVKKDNVISWWKDGDDYYIVASKAKVEGKLTKVKSDKLTIDGKAYSFKKADNATFTLNDDEDIELWLEKPTEIDDLDGEEVEGLLNLMGHVRHLRGAAGKTTGKQYGIVTATPSDSKITVFNKDGEEVTYELDKKTDWSYLKDNMPSGKKYYGTWDDLGYYVLSYKVNADGKIAVSKDDVGVKTAVNVTGQAKTSGQPAATVPAGAVAAKGDVYKGDKKDDYIRLGGSTGTKYYIDSNTVVMRAVNSKGELDPEVIKWADFKELVLTDAYNYAVVFGEANKDAKAIIFLDAKFKGTSEDDYFGVVTDKPWKSGGDWYAEIDVFDKEVAEYKLADDPTDVFAKGSLVRFSLNAKGEADVEEVVKTGKDLTASKVTKAKDLYITVGGAAYKVAKDAVVYDLDKKGALDNKLGASDIEVNDMVYVLDDDGVVKAAVIKVKADSSTTTPDVEGMGTVVGVGGDPKITTVRIKVGSVTKTYSLAEDCIYVFPTAITKLAVDQEVDFEVIEGTSTIGYIEVLE